MRVSQRHRNEKIRSLTRILLNLGYKGYRVTSSKGAGWRVTLCNLAWVTGLQIGLGAGVNKDAVPCPAGLVGYMSNWALSQNLCTMCYYNK